VRLKTWLDVFRKDKAGGSAAVMAVCGSEEIEIRAVCDDTRRLSPGSLFVAVKGSAEDGHAHIGKALRQGAQVVVHQTPLPESLLQTKGSTKVRVADSRKARAHLAAFFFGHPAKALRLIGVTGTNGKTTTAYLIHAMLQDAGFKSGLLSTIAYHLGNRVAAPRHTTPGVLELQRLFREMYDAGLTHAVMEVSSHALEQGRASGCAYAVSVFTNLTQDHLDYHGSMEAYFEAKKQLFLQTQGKALVNIDDAWGRRLQQAFAEKSWSYSLERRADIQARELRLSSGGLWMRLRTPRGEMEVSSPLIGRYNAYNLLAAVGAGLFLGLRPAQVIAGLASFPGVPGRFEKIDLGQDFRVIVDYAHSPDALFRLLEAVQEMAPEKIITLFGCGGDRDRDKRAKMAAAAGAFSHKIILSSDNPRSEPPLEILREIAGGIPEDKKADTECIEDRKTAIFRAIDLAAPGDAVVIAGKGHEQEQIIGDLRMPFDDREMARAALTARARREKDAGRPHVEPL